jgi:hypothetical protein
MNDGLEFALGADVMSTPTPLVPRLELIRKCFSGTGKGVRGELPGRGFGRGPNSDHRLADNGLDGLFCLTSRKKYLGKFHREYRVMIYFPKAV